MSPSRNSLCLNMLTLLLGALTLLAQGCGSSEKPASPVELNRDEFYVWQRNWTAPVLSGLKRAAPESGGWMVLCGEFSIEGGALEFAPVAVDWPYLHTLDLPVTAVFRANVSLLPTFSGEREGGMLDRMSSAMKKTLDAADALTEAVTGVQLDFDCPTRALGDYAEGLKRLRQSAPERVWSITVLPSWLVSSDFPALVDGIEYYVLQVHAFERPESVDAELTVFDAERFPVYLRRADLISTPFVVALPTYGYEVGFGEDGEFAGLRAEAGGTPWPASSVVKTVMADAAAVASAVESLRTHPPVGFRGIVWFRLPIDGDRLNWTWDTLAAVRKGTVPVNTFEVELRQAGGEPHEIWVRNTGERGGWQSVTVDVEGNLSDLAAYDLLEGYRLVKMAQDGLIITGRAPKAGEAKQVAWLRLNGAPSEHLSARIMENN